MKARITFPVEPSTTYVYTFSTLEEAIHEAFDLARRMDRDEWSLEFGGDTMTFRRSGISFVQVA